MIISRQILSIAVASGVVAGAGLIAASPGLAVPATAVQAVSSESMGQTAIIIEDFAYSGPGTVLPGSLVSVTNTDTEAHSVTADNGAFDVTVPGGETSTFIAPDEGGTYGYFCKFHENMTGTLTVAAGAPTSRPIAPAPSVSPVSPAQPDSADTADADGMDDSSGADQVGTVPRGAADTGAAQTTRGEDATLLLGGGLSLIALAGGAYVVRRRICA